MKTQLIHYMYSLIALSTTMCCATQTNSNNSAIQQEHTRYILTIDGGGIRGIIPAQVLHRFEQTIKKEIKKHNPNFCGEICLAKLLNLMIGTSTGGIIVLGLNIPDDENPSVAKYVSKHLVDLYQKRGSEVFSKENKHSTIESIYKAMYKPEGLEKVLADYFKDVPLSASIGNVGVTAFNLHSARTVLLDSSKAREMDDENYHMADSGRATSAAPTYFPKATVHDLAGNVHQYGDGGLGANNPVMQAYKRARELFPHDNLALLSLGTGICKNDDLATANQGLIGWAPAIANVLMNNESDSHHNAIASIQASDPKFKSYIRIQTQLSKKRSELDNVTPDNIEFLREVGNGLYDEHQKEMSAFAVQLAQVFLNSPHHKPVVRLVRSPNQQANIEEILANNTHSSNKKKVILGVLALAAAAGTSTYAGCKVWEYMLKNEATRKALEEALKQQARDNAIKTTISALGTAGLIWKLIPVVLTGTPL